MTSKLVSSSIKSFPYISSQISKSCLRSITTGPVGPKVIRTANKIVLHKNTKSCMVSLFPKKCCSATLVYKGGAVTVHETIRKLSVYSNNSVVLKTDHFEMSFNNKNIQ